MMGGGSVGKNFCREVLSGVSRESFIFIALSEIITAFPIKPHSLSVLFISVLLHWIAIFNSSLLLFSSLPTALLYNGSSITPFFPSVLAHLAVISQCLRCALSSHPFLYCYFFPLLPSFLPPLWQPGLLRCRLREPRIHVVQGGRWGTWGMGPLAKTTSPAVAWCLLLPTDLCPPRYFTLSPKIHPSLNHSFFPFLSLSPKPLTKSRDFLLNLKWNASEISVQLTV